ncbi:SDR family NAD(P)-dependent oxidoreductase [Dactylosporangium vinaceum]|uniref:SDR family NAD(P)-dependent oxidoreductase n=1 Tax=Dactylosporangium vinaceum TaxID=53362 RepID=A0ABV5MCP3_9ACTN|nr:SDR family NAD(P)-dependent oxidoreductase [Dactylosporangium vinaceum]UAC00686.1 SDR family NAD(P)-dependent oxidoreductase [Dactylosporangium vinaceum]
MTVLITGPTRGLGRAATLAMAGRTDLILVGRDGAAMDTVAAQARAKGSKVHTVGADLARLADVRAAAARVRAEGFGPLRALIANAGAMSADTRQASADGYELTFAVNYLAHAQLIGDLLDVFAAPARIVLLGSNTYSANFWRRLLHVPEAQWRDPVDLARPATGPRNPGLRAGGVAYSNAKLALLYYAHELQHHTAPGIGVSVFEPGWMPATALGRGAPPALQALSRAPGRLPGVSKPARSGPALAALALDDRWAHLRDGAFVLKDRVIRPRPVAFDRDREQRLWAATGELLDRAAAARQ